MNCNRPSGIYAPGFMGGAGGQAGGGTSSTPSISGAAVSPSSGSYTGGEYIVVTGASGIDLGATLTVGGVATPMLRLSDTSFAFVPRFIAVGSVGAKDLVLTNPNALSSTKTGGYTYKAQSALAFSSMTALLAAKDDYPTGTMFRGVDSSSNHVCHLIKDTDGAVELSGFVDWTKWHAFADAASHQFADISGTTNLTVDSNGVTFDVASGGAIYLKGFKAHIEQRSLSARADLLAGNATASTNDIWYAGWITDPTTSYTLNSGCLYFNGTNWRQGRAAGSSVTAPTVTQASNNMVLTPSAVAFERYVFRSIHAICEDGTESMTLGANKESAAYFPQNDGSTTLNTSVAMAVSAGQKIWFLCFGARSASTGTAQMRLVSSVISSGAML